MKMNLESIKNSVKNNEVYWTLHAEDERFQDYLSKSEVLKSILYGEIIEEYPNDKPLPICLVFGTVNNKNIHSVIGVNSGTNSIRIITVYIPSLEKFENDFRTRRSENE